LQAEKVLQGITLDILSLVLNSSCGPVKFIHLQILHTEESSLNIINCLEQDLGDRNCLLHQTSPMTDNF